MSYKMTDKQSTEGALGALAAPTRFSRAITSPQIGLALDHRDELIAGHVSRLGDAELADEGDQPTVGAQLDGEVCALDHAGSPLSGEFCTAEDRRLPGESDGAAARIIELERAVGACVMTTWLDMTSNGLRFDDMEENSALSMIFAAAGFDPTRDDIVAFRNAYMARFAPHR